MLNSVCDRVRKMKERRLERGFVIRAWSSKLFDAEFGGGFMKPDRSVGAVSGRSDYRNLSELDPRGYLLIKLWPKKTVINY